MALRRYLLADASSNFSSAKQAGQMPGSPTPDETTVVDLESTAVAPDWTYFPVKPCQTTTTGGSSFTPNSGNNLYAWVWQPVSGELLGNYALDPDETLELSLYLDVSVHDALVTAKVIGKIYDVYLDGGSLVAVDTGWTGSYDIPGTTPLVADDVSISFTGPEYSIAPGHALAIVLNVKAQQSMAGPCTGMELFFGLLETGKEANLLANALSVDGSSSYALDFAKSIPTPTIYPVAKATREVSVEVESDLLNPGSHPIQRTVEVAPVSDIITPVHVDAASILDVGFSASNTLQVKQETSYRVTFAAVCDRIVGIVSRALAAVGITVSCENEVGSYATRWTDDRVAQSFNWTDDRVTT